MFVKKTNIFSEKILLVSLSQKNQTAYETLIKEQIFHKFPKHWAMRGSSSL